MKKLYRVDISVMVMAESEDQALIAMTEEISSGSDLDFTELGEASEARSVPSRWYDEVPFNADDESKCSEILKRERAQRGAA